MRDTTCCDLMEARIAGTVAFERPVTLHGAHLVIELADAGMADAPARVVGRTRRTVSADGVRNLAFELVATVVPERTYSLAAEVRRGDHLQPGDFRNVASHPWQAGDAGPIRIAVQPIV